MSPPPDPLPLDSAAIPRATYRIQFHAGFRLADAEAIVPYLASLGVSHLYASPLLKARTGSLHGYDVVDPTVLNPELGTDADFARLQAALRAHGMQLLLDIVPNHMGVLEADNPWWLDVLENGRASRHATWFDIEWSPPHRELHGKLLLPVLGEPYGEVLESGTLRPDFDADSGQFLVRYHSHRFPLDLGDYARLMRLQPLPAAVPAADQARLDELLAAFSQLRARDLRSSQERTQRQAQVRDLKRRLVEFRTRAAWADDWLRSCTVPLRGEAGVPESFDALDRLLNRQAWRLVHWRAAADDVNYRRFFDINGLAALRVEEAEVFEASHALVLDWVGQGRVAGLRIDHPDGMSDPKRYFERLQRRCAQARRDDPARATYVVVEKILAENEPWPRDWPVHGETGYRFSNQVHGVFVDAAQAAAFDDLYQRFVGAPVDYAAELDAAKRQIMQLSLASDLRLLTELAHDVALTHRHTRDLTREGLRAVIMEFVAAFDVYRSYVGDSGPGPLDRASIERAAATARGRCRPSQLPYLDFIRGLMLEGGTGGSGTGATADADTGAGDTREAMRLRFVRRLQQFSAPVMAKGMEDTAFYRFHRLSSLNDVGGDPLQFGHPVEGFHAANAARRQDMPHTLLAASTHDSKRSADVRCRLAVLSEMPAQWLQTLERWRGLTRAQWRIGGLEQNLEPNDELLLYQTLVGVCPAGPIDDDALAALRQRIAAYMLKAVREAKQRSSWLDGDTGYERTVERCIELLLTRQEPNPFLSDLRRFVEQVAPFGCCNSLGAVALQLTSPGVPDIYQGCEHWMHALVDPDNRRPVDFNALQRALGALRGGSTDGIAAMLRESLPGGPHKLFVTMRLLQWRREAEALFRDGEYVPLAPEGPHAAHAVAFARTAPEACSVTVVGRLLWQLTSGSLQAVLDGSAWGTDALPLPEVRGAVAWEDVLSGRRVHRDAAGRVPLKDVLADLPVAVLQPLTRTP